jgi:hypothetical protein
MLMKADIMLLDEPTNHLDVTNVKWLQVRPAWAVLWETDASGKWKLHNIWAAVCMELQLSSCSSC